NINDVLNTMAKHQIKRLIVEDNKLAVGIISLSDVVNQYSYMSDIIPTLQKIWELHRNIEEKNVSIQTFEL
ncbi:MAG: CBS domain-containing protein, partial [Bacilli bacterium]|nr:CBS domain-containing protein [Bacilli bacterium]